MLVTFVQLQDVPQVALEPERSTDQETSRPPERVRTVGYIILSILIFTFLSFDLTAMHSTSSLS
jgi:hypothetical protein